MGIEELEVKLEEKTNELIVALEELNTTQHALIDKEQTIRELRSVNDKLMNQIVQLKSAETGKQFELDQANRKRREAEDSLSRCRHGRF